MPRIRTLKPEFFRSPSTARVDFAVRLFYQALWCWADDFGIGETNINGLLGFAFPDSDGFTAEDVRRFCAECAQAYGVIFYIVRERHYYAVPTWNDHQKTERREDRRKHPTPDDPDAVPDQQFKFRADSAQNGASKPAQNVREIGAGTGEQGNRGTGNSGGNGSLVSHQGAKTGPPPEKCFRHRDKPRPPSCGGCADARRAYDAWMTERQLAESAQRQAANEARINAIDNCTLCGPDGYRLVGSGVCDHDPTQFETNRAGSEAVRAALKAGSR